MRKKKILLLLYDSLTFASSKATNWTTLGANSGQISWLRAFLIALASLEKKESDRERKKKKERKKEREREKERKKEKHE